MYLFYNLGRYSVRVDGDSRRLVVERSKNPLPYAKAAELAERSARSDSESYPRPAAFRTMGTRFVEAGGNGSRYPATRPCARRPARCRPTG